MNVHPYILYYILHQLLKSVIGDIYILQWLKNIFGAKFKKVYIKASRTKSFYQTNRTIFLEELFHYMSLYLILKIFKEYSKVK